MRRLVIILAILACSQSSLAGAQAPLNGVRTNCETRAIALLQQRKSATAASNKSEVPKDVLSEVPNDTVTKESQETGQVTAPAKTQPNPDDDQADATDTAAEYHPDGAVSQPSGSDEASGAHAAPPVEDEPEMPSAPLPPVAGTERVADAVWVLEPVYTRAFTPIQPGHNDANPLWSPSGNMLAFERSIGDQRKIVIAQRDGTIIKTIYFQTPEEDGGVDFFFPGITESASYNAGMSWSGDGSGLVFMSNGGSGNYDLYLLPHLSHNQPIRLTRHPEKDSHPHWSPVTNRLVFVSGRTGKADIFTMNLATRQTKQITRGPKMYHYPQWSPDGSKIAMIYGSNENHDIITIENMAVPTESTKTLTTWPHDDLRPTWSPDGKKIAFYSNYNLEGDSKKWCIIVLPADGPEVPSREILSAGVVAHQVIPDVEQGPAWMPDSRHMVYVKNDEQAFNPIFLVDIEEKTPIAVRTGTKMNHDLTCARDGTLAFRAQEDQWDHIYVSKIDPEMAVLEEIK